MTVNQSKKQDKQYQVPMVVTDEVIRDFGIKPEEVTWRRIGNRKCRVVMVDVVFLVAIGAPPNICVVFCVFCQPVSVPDCAGASFATVPGASGWFPPSDAGCRT